MRSGAPPGIDIFTQLQNTFTNGIMAGFNGLLNNCVTKNLAETAISTTKDVLDSERQQILGSLKHGDFTALKRSLQGSGLKAKLIDKATNAVDLAKTMNTPSFNMAKLSSLQNDMTRRIKSVTDIANSGSPFELLKNTRNATLNTGSLITVLNKELKDLGIK